MSAVFSGGWARQPYANRARKLLTDDVQIGLPSDMRSFARHTVVRVANLAAAFVTALAAMFISPVLAPSSSAAGELTLTDVYEELGGGPISTYQGGFYYVIGVVVANTSGSSVTDIVLVQDPSGPALTCPASSLAAGESMTCFVPEPILGAYVRDVTATYLVDGVTAEQASIKVGLSCPRVGCAAYVDSVSSVSIVGANGNAATAMAQTNTYALGSSFDVEFTVTNDGIVPVQVDSVSTSASLTCATPLPATLDPGKSIVCTRSDTADAAGEYNAIVSYRRVTEGKHFGSFFQVLDAAKNSTATTSWSLEVVPVHDMTVVFTTGGVADPQADGNAYDPGETVTYQMVVTNTGNASLTAVQVFGGSWLAGASCDAPITTPSPGTTTSPGYRFTITFIVPGQSVTCTHAVTDVQVGYQGTVTVRSTNGGSCQLEICPPGSLGLSRNDPTDYTVPNGFPPFLTLDYTNRALTDPFSDLATYVVGEPSEYRAVITNTSADIGLVSLVLTFDGPVDLGSTAVCSPDGVWDSASQAVLIDKLAPGQSVICVMTTTATLSGMSMNAHLGGNWVCVARGCGDAGTFDTSDPTGMLISASQQLGPLTIDYTNGNAAVPHGDSNTYVFGDSVDHRITIRNTSDAATFTTVELAVDGFNASIFGSAPMLAFSCSGGTPTLDLVTGHVVLHDVAPGAVITCTMSHAGQVPYDGQATAVGVQEPACNYCSSATSVISNHTQYSIVAPTVMTVDYTNGNATTSMGDGRTYDFGDNVTLRVVITNLQPEVPIRRVVIKLRVDVLALLTCDVPFTFVPEATIMPRFATIEIDAIPAGGVVTCTGETLATMNYDETVFVSAKTDGLMCVGEGQCADTELLVSDPTDYDTGKPPFIVPPTTAPPTTAPSTTVPSTTVPSTTPSTVTTQPTVTSTSGPTTTSGTTGGTTTSSSGQTTATVGGRVQSPSAVTGSSSAPLAMGAAGALGAGRMLVLLSKRSRRSDDKVIDEADD